MQKKNDQNTIEDNDSYEGELEIIKIIARERTFIYNFLSKRVKKFIPKINITLFCNNRKNKVVEILTTILLFACYELILRIYCSQFKNLDENKFKNIKEEISVYAKKCIDDMKDGFTMKKNH